METIKMSMVDRGVDSREMNTTTGFSGQGKCSMYAIIKMDIFVCHRTFVQIHSTCNSKGEPSGKLWTSGHYDVSMQVHPLVKNAPSGERGWRGQGYAYVGQGVQDTLHLPLSFIVKLKLFFKRLSL